MDELTDLLRALARIEGVESRRARLRKRKRLRKAGARPAKPGSKSGCGTGAGGFGYGNSCAKEDGVPQKPFGQGGGLKRVDPAKDRAKAEAMKGEYLRLKKQKKIARLRKEAAARKAQKGERDTAEKQAASEAAAKKRAAMLQKIRVKKASEKLNVVGTPKSVKDELGELKAKKASEKLNVVGTPKSIKEELAELKAKQASEKSKAEGAAKAKQDLDNLKDLKATEKKTAEQLKSARKQKADDQGQKPAVSIGKAHDTPKSKQTPEQSLALEQEDRFLFGAHLEPGWKGGSNSDAIRAQVKIAVAKDVTDRMDAMGIKESDIDDDILKKMGVGFDMSGKNISPSLLSKTSGNGVKDTHVRRYLFAEHAIRNWANTSGDHAFPSVGMQWAIKDELKLGKCYTTHLKHSSDTPKTKKQYGYEKSGAKKDIEAFAESVAVVRKHKAVRAFVRAQYTATQDHLKRLGITELTLVRGWKGRSKISPSGKQRVSLQPASSFTTHKKTADAFSGSGKLRRVIVATVPANKIFSTSVTGFGCLNEREIVVLGGTVTGTVTSKFDW